MSVLLHKTALINFLMATTVSLPKISGKLFLNHVFKAKKVKRVKDKIHDIVR